MPGIYLYIYKVKVKNHAFGTFRSSWVRIYAPPHPRFQIPRRAAAQRPMRYPHDFALMTFYELLGFRAETAVGPPALRKE